jgi:Disulphide bond corrector protein DsbC
MRVRSICVAILCNVGAWGVSNAQVADPTVDWAASWKASSAVKPGGRGDLELSGVVQDGWHVYALTQPPGGPVALRVSIDENPIASLGGSPSGTPPQSRHDPSFDLDTHFYTHSFAVQVPVALKSQVQSGRQLIPVSVRFQTCSARECQPPKTVHLSVPVDVLPETSRTGSR